MNEWMNCYIDFVDWNCMDLTWNGFDEHETSKPRRHTVECKLPPHRRSACHLPMTLTFDLWPWKAFQQWLLTRWSLVPSFVEIPPPREEKSRLWVYVLMDVQDTAGRIGTDPKIMRLSPPVAFSCGGWETSKSRVNILSMSVKQNVLYGKLRLVAGRWHGEVNCLLQWGVNRSIITATWYWLRRRWAC